jgi:hypothetical protein
LLILVVGLLALAAPVVGWFAARQWAPAGSARQIVESAHGQQFGDGPSRDPSRVAGSVSPTVSAPVAGIPVAGGVTGRPVHPGSAGPVTTTPAPAGPKTPASTGPTARPNPGGVNLALAGTASASSTESNGLGAAKAFDGDPDTRWSSAFSDPQWLEVDLGTAYQISDISLSWQRSHATAYRVELSTDGTTWTTVYSTSDGQGGTVDIPVNRAPARYVRMYGTARSGRYGYSLFEMAVR